MHFVEPPKRGLKDIATAATVAAAFSAFAALAICASVAAAICCIIIGFDVAVASAGVASFAAAKTPLAHNTISARRVKH